MYGSLREYLKHCQKRIKSSPLYDTQPSSPSPLTHEPAWYRGLSQYMAQRSSRYIEEATCECYTENPWNLYRNFDGGQCVFRQHLAHSGSGYYNQQIVNSLELVEPVSPCTCDGEEGEEQRQLHDHLYYQQQSDDHHQQRVDEHHSNLQTPIHCQHREQRSSSHPLPDCCDGCELSACDIVNFALQIARGMEHLQQMKV